MLTKEFWSAGWIVKERDCYEDAYQEIAKLKLAFDKHMEKAESIFFKKLNEKNKTKKAKGTQKKKSRHE